MIKKIMLASYLLVASMASQAALISYNGYERDTANNYVTGGGLEWLMWDVTKGMSINTAISAHGVKGWRLASNVEMASLFNRFKFGKDDWNSNENVTQSMNIYWHSSELTGAHYFFSTLFGVTQESKCHNIFQYSCFSLDDPFRASLALFGSDLNKNLKFNAATVRDDRTFLFDPNWRQQESAEAHLGAEWADSSWSHAEIGVALVRSIVRDPVAVPTPGSIGLLALGLVALGYRRRQVLGR